uniref:Tubulin domain-containing protein n=1 Tax=Macrostomum lignano TaxID=282301 RepID=A0A1I8HCU4_9PLAT
RQAVPIQRRKGRQPEPRAEAAAALRLRLTTRPGCRILAETRQARQKDGRTCWARHRPYPQTVSVHIGQAGCQLGHAVWELYCLEHGVQADGRAGPWKACARETAESAFSRNGNRFTPRAVMCDTDPTVIDEVRHGAYRQLFAPDCLISHKEGAAGNYAVGRNAVGRAILPQVSQAVRRQAEACDRLEGLILYHSYGGGTGPASRRCSWRACATATAGRRCCRWPCTLHQRTVEPYNTVACLQACEPLSNGVILLDNEAMYGIIQKYFGGSMTSSDYTRANRLCAQLISSLTAGFRFSGEQNATLADISTNLIPYPRLIYLSPSYAPMRRSGYVESSDKREPHLSSCKTEKFSCRGGGAVRRKPVRQNSRQEQAVSRCLHDVPRRAERLGGQVGAGRTWSDLFGRVKIAHNDQPPTRVPDTGIDVGPSALAVLSNTPAVVGKFRNLGRKFDSMFGQGAFLATYLANGYNRDQFVSAREHLSSIDQAYMESVDDPSVYDTPTASPGEQPRGPEQYRMKFSRPNGPGFHGPSLDGSGLDGSGLDGSGLDGSGLDGSGLDG